MTDIRYLAAQTLDEAVGAFAAAQGAARILAGGTDLLVQMRAGAVEPGLIVDIKRIAEMTEIVETPMAASASAPPSPARRSPSTRASARPGRACGGANLIGSTQVQGRATPGGNLCNGSPAADSVPAHDRGRRGASPCRARTGRRDHAGRGRAGRPRPHRR